MSLIWFLDPLAIYTLPPANSLQSVWIAYSAAVSSDKCTGKTSQNFHLPINRDLLVSEKGSIKLMGKQFERII